MTRAPQLLRIEIRAYLHQLRHDLGKELSVLAASLIMLATFGYVFNDFLNVQIASLSAAMREAVARAGAATLLAVATAGAGHSLRHELDAAASTRRMALQLGELPTAVRRYVLARSTVVLTFWHGVAWAITYRYLIRPSWTIACLGEAVMLGSALLWICIAKPAAAGAAERPPALRPSRRASVGGRGSRLPTLLHWRLLQHLRRNLVHQAIYLIALACVGLGAAAYAGGAPIVAPVAAAFVAGVLLAAILALALAQDLRHAWVEHALGVAHDEIVGAYAALAASLAVPAALATALMVAAAAPAGVGLEATLKPAAILLVTPLMAPYLLFQIDARRPGINIMTLIIVGLFLATAIFAHWLGILAAVVTRAAIAGNQAGRFHRA